ncbi:Protein DETOXIFICATION 31 [Vigna angularis]|uniref:Protein DETOXIFICATION 31 n=1 Tax=Phaseolus angularis TaxID=3914 RepID=A0A8T0JNW1_PHAAN|nr:Protein DETOXIFICATION 31 [Vigna angularis]
MEHSDGNSTEPQAEDESNQTRSQQRTAAVFTAGSADMSPITGPGDFYREFVLESKKLWFLAGPGIFSFVSKYSLGAFTQIFAGHIGTIELTAVSVENSLIAGFSYGILLGNVVLYGSAFVRWIPQKCKNLRLFLAFVLMVTRNVYPSLFSNDPEVQNIVKELTPLLSFCIIINNVQPVLSGNLARNDIRDCAANDCYFGDDLQN